MTTIDQRHARPHRNAPTIYDLAEATGLDPSTVSRALRGTGRVSKATRERVAATARELGYRANQMARALNDGRTQTLALMVADITNPIVFDIIRGAENTASTRGYTLVIAESRGSGEIEESALERIIPNVDGVILGMSRLGDDTIRRIAQMVPLTLLNRTVDGVTSVSLDLVTGTRQLMEHLATLGHTAVGYVGTDDSVEIGPRRRAMLIEHAQDLGLALQEVGPYPPSRDGGSAAVEEVLALGVTAVVTFNDVMGIGLLGALRERGVDVPGQISVAGVDNIFGSDFTTPKLTTVTAPIADLAAAGVEAALSLASGQEARPVPALRSSLVVRESTGQRA